MEPYDARNSCDQVLSPENLRAIGQRIASQRKLRGWTQRELARRSEISSSRLSRIEHGGCVMQLSELVQLRSVLNLDADELIFDRPAGARRIERLVRALEEVGDPLVLQVVERLIEGLIHNPVASSLRISLGAAGRASDLRTGGGE